MNWYQRAALRVGHHRWFAALSRRFLTPIDRVLYRVSGGRLSPVGRSVAPVLLLTTTGRRSGKPRTTPLIYVPDGTNYVVSSEDFGHRRPAAWRLNLEAQPRAMVQVGRRVVSCTARLLPDEEADSCWPRLLEVWPAHETYRRRSGQRHTFLLEPVANNDLRGGHHANDRSHVSRGRAHT